ncbi:antagonist of KipI [Filimonas lacunae]|uniref:Antagonist of KipI n=1 Tax=Filimonas lacunae TaxID=477680 RepID=A0A173MQR7_9BACT|nr:biotin-dependent carboxyltransferase family protein [Filimonas lacunae]BAV09721.1 allophanate hydrolase 2 subunit 2 [Filimonas lacunae]SIS77843.1 antagonist of KipI [Filimonas lacunae]
MKVTVIQPGILTTVQDTGRIGYKSQGVVTGGALDGFAHRVSNWLVGNEETCATLEITMGGLQLLFEEKGWVAVGGHGVKVFINNKPVDCWRTLAMPAGGVLKIQYTGTGCRSYLAVQGGWEVPLVLNSFSTYLPAGWGGYQGRPLKKEDILNTGAVKKAVLYSGNWAIAASTILPYAASVVVRAMHGPEWLQFTHDSRALFFDNPLPVLPQSNRMGYRVAAKMKKSVAGEMLSTAVCAGTIQALPDGNMVIMMNDGPTTGGYPRLAQVVEPDIALCAQLLPGNTIEFKHVNIETAEEIYLNYQKQMEELKQYIFKRLYA